MTRAPGKQSRRPGLLDIREKGPRAWSLVHREKVPGTQTLGSEGEEDWVSIAVGFCLIVILNQAILLKAFRGGSKDWENNEIRPPFPGQNLPSFTVV